MVRSLEEHNSISALHYKYNEERKSERSIRQDPDYIYSQHFAGYRCNREQWQLRWTNTTKGAAYRLFFPRLEQRLKIQMPITPEFMVVLTGHGKTKAYLHRFKLADDPMCPCKEGQQTSDNIIFEYNILEAQRTSMIKQIMVSGGPCPPAKDEPITKYLEAFLSFVKLIDFQKLK